MALLSANGFTGYSDSYAIPANSPDVIFSGSVDLILPTGITQQVFGTLSTALKCTHYMEANKLNVLITWRRINYILCRLMKIPPSSI